MAALVPIADIADPRLDDYRHLTDPQRRHRIDAASPPGIFVLEGAAAVRMALGSPYRVRSLLLGPNRVDRLGDVLAAVDGPAFVAPAEVFAGVTGYDVHRGVLAIAERIALPDPADLLARHPTVAVLEGLNDHENLGSVFRSAAAFGVGALLLCPRTADPLYRRSVRVSMGHVLRVPYARLDPWPDALALLREHGFAVWALTPRGEHDIATAPVAERVALLLGAEGPGLSPAAFASSTVRVRIDIEPGVDSLNVSHAAAIAFHTVRRGRR